MMRRMKIIINDRAVNVNFSFTDRRRLCLHRFNERTNVMLPIIFTFCKDKITLDSEGVWPDLAEF